MARGKRNFDCEEVEEIILLKLKELGGIKKKLTYNSVFQFNKKIADNKEYLRANGKFYTLYGYDFWSSHYKGEEYYGRKRIDEIKNNSNVIVAGEEFNADMQDILTLVNDLHNKPSVLAKRLLLVFDRDRSKLKQLEKENEKLAKQNELLNKRIKMFEKGFVSLFYNSSEANNSLENVMSMTKSRDGAVYNELKNMFNNDESRLKKVLNIGNSTSKVVEVKNNIISMEDTEEAKKRRRSKYEDEL